ncbi:MAG: hypothetical protein IH968_11675 [Gemmatimonadetes bacterium]|nr:hypothetical protein [Gemmatimonadota bacterium]
MTLWKLWCRAVPIASVVGLIVQVAPIAGQDAADCDRLCREAAAMIERLALREGPTPVRERPGWAPPVRIVVPSEGWANLLRNVLGTDAEVVGVSSGGARNFSAVADLIEGADVLVGLCSPEIIRRGVDLKWVQLTNAGAGLDVTDPEPLPSGHPLWSMPNVILTPHIAAGSDLVGGRFRALVVENLRRYARGDPVLSVVDLARGY